MYLHIERRAERREKKAARARKKTNKMINMHSWNPLWLKSPQMKQTKQKKSKKKKSKFSAEARSENEWVRDEEEKKMHQLELISGHLNGNINKSIVDYCAHWRLYASLTQ